MKWPFVHRARMEAAIEQRNRWAEHATSIGSIWERRYDSLLSEFVRMKQQGFQPVPPKIGPRASDPQTKFVAEQESAPHDPIIQQLVNEGHSLADARAIRAQAIEDFKNGAM